MSLLEDPVKLQGVLREELIAIRDKFGDERKTEIQEIEDELDIEDLIEEETQLISSAIVDAGVYEAILYTTTYLEPSIQEASVVTYQPSADVLNLIHSNPNILNIATDNLSELARTEMQRRLSVYENTVLYGGDSGNIFNITDTPSIEDAGNMQNEYVEEEKVEEP